MSRATKTLLCTGGTLPFTYLGLPIGCDISRVKSWDPIIDRISKKLDSWKGRLLSIGGRVTLIKSSIYSLSLYYMSIFPIPKSVIEKINKIQRQFLWSGEKGKKSLSLVAWNIVELPKSLGGLNLGNIYHRNLALLYKWIWKFFSDPSPLWRQIVWEKYKYPQTFTIHDQKTQKQGGPWRNICNAVLKNPTSKTLAFQGWRMLIGDGADTLFWHHVWIGPKPLKILFPRLFLLAAHKSASIASMGY